MKKKKNVCFVKLNVGAVSFSWCHATCSERARERGWHLSLSHSFTLTHSLCQFPLLSQSISLSLTKPGCDDSVTAPQKKKKKESHFEVEMWGSCQGGQSGGSLCAMSLCVSLRVRWCVRMPVCKCAMHAQTDRWWAEGGKEGWEFKNGVTDGLIARADLNHRRYKKRI